MQPVHPIVPVQLAGDWSIDVGPATVKINGKQVKIAKPVRLEVSRPGILREKDEKHSPLLVFNEQGGGWMRGSQLRKVTRDGCAFTNLHIPDSVKVKAAKGSTSAFIADKDYRVDPFWGVLGRTAKSSIHENQTVYVDYEYCLPRLDSIVVDQRGRVRLICGQPAIGNVLPPDTKPGEMTIANIWISGRIDRLSDENLFPIDKNVPPLPQADGNVAEKLLPKTLAKLRAGENVTVIAWGDSVTHFCSYQVKFVEELRRRFPRAILTLRTAAWPGGNSDNYMSQPPGSLYDFNRDVLDRKPDLVTIEFVNDAGLKGKDLEKQYARIMKRLKGIGAEVILITPHFVRPDWMGVDTQKLDDDPRPYVQGLRAFATKHKIALADASRYWARLWRQGIPYLSLHMNGINHPDTRGHDFFVQALTNLFPEK